MIVFYTKSKPTISVLDISVCESVCSASVTKPKSRCCNKYKKKGINCKRCPNTLLQAAS